MSGMNEFLAAHYGTANTASSQPVSEDVEKQAQYELFAKLAADQNIDLGSLSDADTMQLWNQFQKIASEEGKEKDKDDDKEKVEKAKEEHEEKKAAAEKLAEADFLGRVMAHSYVDELKKIASSNETPEPTEEEASKEAAMPAHIRAAFKAKYTAQNAVGHAKHIAGKGADKAKEVAGKAKDFGGKAVDKVKEHKGAIGSHSGAAAGGAAAGAGAAALAMHKKEKKASALDELACNSALEKAAGAGFDVEEAGTRINAVLQLPISENTKIAQVADLDSAIEVRSLELLEMAGYPVTWNS